MVGSLAHKRAGRYQIVLLVRRTSSGSTTQCVVDGGTDSLEVDVVNCADVFGEHGLRNGVKAIAIDR